MPPAGDSVHMGAKNGFPRVRERRATDGQVTLQIGPVETSSQYSARAPQLPTLPLAYNAIAQFLPPFNSAPNERTALYLRAKQGFSQFAFPAKE